MNQPTLKFSDRVVNRKLSNTVIIGTVTGIVFAKHFPGGKRWTEVYPDWEKDYVVYVTLDQPDSEQDKVIAFPIADLLLLEEACNIELESSDPV